MKEVITMQAAILTPADASIPDPQELLRRARELVPVLAERAEKGNELRRIPDETIRDFKEAGLFRVLQPKRYGGYELSPNLFYDLVMTLAEGDMSAAWVYSVVGVHPWQMALFDDRAQQEVWGKDANTLIASTYMPTGRARRVEGGFRFSGRWGYSSGSDHCDWVFLGGLVETQPGEPMDARTWLVPRSDFQIVDTWHTTGLKATGSKDIVIEDCFIPEYRTLSMFDCFQCRGPGQAVNTSALFKMPFGQVFPRAVSTASIGALQGMLNAFIDTAKQRVNVMGMSTAKEPIAQLVVAEAVNAIEEMKTILHRNLDRVYAYAERGEIPPMDERLKYKFQATYPPERVAELAARLFKAAGGAAVYSKNPFGRMLNDINTGRQHANNQYQFYGANYGKLLMGQEFMDFMV